MPLGQLITALVHVHQSQLVARRKMPGLELERQLETLFGKLQLGSIPGRRDQVISVAVQELQIWIGDIKLQRGIEHPGRMIEVIRLDRPSAFPNEHLDRAPRRLCNVPVHLGSLTDRTLAAEIPGLRAGKKQRQRQRANNHAAHTPSQIHKILPPDQRPALNMDVTL